MILLARLFLIALLLAPTAAHAESALVFAPRSEHALSAAERAELTAAIERAVRGQGVEPTSLAAEDACVTAECVIGHIRNRGAAHAVELTVWRAPEGVITGVSVALVQPAGERFSEGASVEQGQSVEAAIERAVHGAYERLRRGPGPWLQLEGSPSGAAISIDGQAAGVLPRQVRVTGGLHHVVVSHAGHASFDEMVTVPRNPDALKRIAVTLEPESSALRTTPVRSTRRSAWNYVIAGAAIVTAATLAIRPVRSAIDDGECGRVEQNRCIGVVDFDAGQAVQLGAAGLLLAAGVTIAVWAPLRTSPDGVMTNIAVAATF